MKDIKKMTYDEMVKELNENRIEMRTATKERKHELIRRDHELMTEMDAMWQRAEDKRKAAGSRW